MTLRPTRPNAKRMPKAKINFRVAIKNNRQIAGCEFPIASFPSCARAVPQLAIGRDQSPLLPQSLEILGYGRNSNVLFVESRALNDFHSIFGNLLAHIDTKGYAHQVGVLELHPRPFVPVVQQNVVPGGLELPGDILGGGADLLVFRVGGNDHHLERRDGRRQPEAVLVVTLLDRRRQDALDANSVTAHDRGDLLAIAVEHTRAHGFRILVSQLENVPDFDGGINAQRSATVGAVFACLHGPQAKQARLMSGPILVFAIAVDATMVPFLVCACYPITLASRAKAVLKEHFSAHSAKLGAVPKPLFGAKIPWLTPENLGRLSRGHRSNCSRELSEKFCFVELIVSAQENYNGRNASVELRRNIRERLKHRVFWHVQIGRHVLNAFQVRRRNQPLWQSGSLIDVRRTYLRSRLLHIRRVPALLAAHDQVLARRSPHHEFLRLRSAHGARVRIDHHVLQSAAVEDAAVGVVILEVRNVKPGRINVERVGVLHDELTHAQQARLGARLVAKFGLNLIPDLRQLLVAAQFLARDVGHDFLMGHAQTKVGALAILEAKHVVAHRRPAPALFPNFTRIQRRQVELLPDLVHFLADDARDLLNSAIAEEQERIDPSAQLTNVSRADQQLVTSNFGISRSLAKSGNKELRPAVHDYGFQSKENLRL